MYTQKNTKVCLSAMVANESRVILRMLESCYLYIDYWIIQDNGSTDDTKEIIIKFFEEKNIPGFLYETKWEYPGFNRDHLIQMCLKAEHGCDWILRMDADEQLEVDADFDWSILEDKSIQSFNITADAGDSLYYRTWFWNARLPWNFKHDKRHEVILLPGSGQNDEGFQRINLPRSFRHRITNDGQTWDSPMKFLKDAMELEIDQVTTGKILEDNYHLFYIGKSYSDCYGNSSEFPFKEDHAYEYARRCIFYFEKYLDVLHGWKESKTGHYQNEMSYFAMCLIGNAYRFIGDNQLALYHYRHAEQFCPDRNEHIMWTAELFESIGDYNSMLDCTTRLTDPARKNPFPGRCFLLLNQAYHDTGTYAHDLHKIAINNASNIPVEDKYVLNAAEGPSLTK